MADASDETPSFEPHEVKDLLQVLPETTGKERDRARAAAVARPTPYPVGSGGAEKIALVAGFKPLIRQLLAAEDLDSTRTRFESAGFITELSPRLYGPTQDGLTLSTGERSQGAPLPPRRALFVGRDRQRIAEAIACDLAKTNEGDTELGRLLGYPRCCVEAFVGTSDTRPNAEVYAAALARTEGAPEPLLNVLDMHIFHFISWAPCSYRCPLSLRFAAAVGEVVSRRHARFVSTIDAALAAHRLVLIDEVQLSLRGPFDGERVRPSSVWPAARDRHPASAALDPDALEAVARALVLVSRAREVSVLQGVLHLDGRPMPTPSPAVLVPFGTAVHP